MGKTRCSLLLSLVLVIAAPVTAFAAETPSPQPNQTTTPIKHVLTQAQKAAIALARSDFAAAKANAQGGFDRALADAQAVRDQAIADAGSNKNLILLARKTYKDSFLTILNAYRADLKTAKLNLVAALAAAKATNVSH